MKSGLDLKINERKSVSGSLGYFSSLCGAPETWANSRAVEFFLRFDGAYDTQPGL